MAGESKKVNDALSARSAYQLADVTKTAPQYEAITPRWTMKMLEWKGLDSGIFRLNKVRDGETLLDVLCAQDNDAMIPQTYIDYEQKPREYILNSVSVIIKIGTRVSDIYSVPHDQVKEQLRLAVESIRVTLGVSASERANCELVLKTSFI